MRPPIDLATVGAELAPIAELAPDVMTLLGRTWESAVDTLDPALYEVARLRVESEHRLRPYEPPPESRAAEIVSEFAAQFVVYVPGVSDDLRARLNAELGADALSLVQGIWIVDQIARLRLAYGRLFSGGAFARSEPVSRTGIESLDELVHTLHHHCSEPGSLDPLTVETVRLRCAEYHHCRLCGAVRFALNGELIADDNLIAKISRYEDSDLDERRKTALRYADAYMTAPQEVQAAKLQAHFSVEQIVRLTLNVVAWNYQKVLVALDTDIPDAGDDCIREVADRFAVRDTLADRVDLAAASTPVAADDDALEHLGRPG